MALDAEGIATVKSSQNSWHKSYLETHCRHEFFLTDSILHMHLVLILCFQLVLVQSEHTVVTMMSKSLLCSVETGSL